MKKRLLFGLLLAYSLGVSAQAPVQNFALTNVADNTIVPLESYPSCAGIAIIFTSNTCPFDGSYTERIRQLVAGYTGKIQFLLINSYPEEDVEGMRAAYDGWNIPAPYLADKDQVAMDCLGARKSPEAFLLKNVNGHFTVIYGGAIDDNAQVAAGVSRSYLKTAIDHLLAGQPVALSSSRAVGCTIRKK